MARYNSIQYKLWIGLLILFLLISIQGGLLYWILTREHQIMNEIDYLGERYLDLAEARYNHRGWMQQLENAFLTGDIPGVEHYTHCLLGEWLYSMTPSPEEQQDIERFKEIHKELHNSAELVTEYLSNGDEEQGRQEFIKNTIVLSDRMEEIMDVMEENADQRITKLDNYLSDFQKTEIILLFTLTLVILGGAVFVSANLNKQIIKPILSIADGMKRIKEGNLDTKLPVQQKDEIGFLTENFNEMIEPLSLEKRSHNLLEILVSGNKQDQIIHDITHEIGKIKGVLSVAIYLYDEWKNNLTLASGYSIPDGIKEVYKLDEGLIGEVATHREIITVDNPEDEWKIMTGVLDISLHFITGIPVFYKDKLLGVMVVGSNKDLKHGQLRELNNLSYQMGITLNNINQYKSIQELVRKLERKNKELYEQKSYAEAVLRSSAEGIFSIDNEKIVKTWSKGAEKITGFKSEEVIGRSICSFLKHLDKSGANLCGEDCCFIDEISNKSGKEIYLQTKDGKIIPCIVSVATIYDENNNAIGSVQVFRDISREKADMLKIEKANRAKSEFLATMSHELRTPLNSILGFSELMENGLAGELNEKQRRYFKNIISSGHHLLSLINDILDISKVEAGRLKWDIKRFNLVELLENNLLMIKGKAGERDIKVVKEIDEEGLQDVEGDELKIKQTVYNLLSNAVKFTPEGGQVGLKARREGDYAYIEVWDTGIGIPEDKQEIIFEPFIQLDSSLGRKYEGTGLGLNLVKQFIQLGGGEIDVESRVGEGSKFILKLPLKSQIIKRNHEIKGVIEIEESMEKPEETMEKSEDKIKREIAVTSDDFKVKGKSNLALVIEDDIVSAHLINEYLQELNFETIFAEDGEKGLELAYEYLDKLDLITLDIMLPGFNGWEVLNKLNEEGITGKVPVVITSIIPDKNKGLALGAVDYLVKPYTKKEVNEVLQRINELKINRKHKKLDPILAIDDEPMALEIIEEVLIEQGYEVFKAYGGREGLEKARNNKPGVILLDLMMPEIDGIEVLHELENDPDLCDIPVIILTAKILTEEEKKALTKRVYMIANKSELKLDRFKIAVKKACKEPVD